MNQILNNLPPNFQNNARQIVKYWIEKYHSTKNNYFAQKVEEVTGYYPDHPLYQSENPRPTMTENELIEDSLINPNHIY